MGPYSEERQFQRAEAITTLLANPNLPKETRVIWQNHLANLARNETTYNFRVKEIYSKMKRQGVIHYE
jgi:hypothetical protein